MSGRPARRPLGAVTAALLGAFEDEEHPRGLDSFHRAIGSSPAVASRLRRMWEQYENEMAALLGAERNEAVPCPETRLVAAQLIALVRITTSPDALAFVREHRSAPTEASPYASGSTAPPPSSATASPSGAAAPAHRLRAPGLALHELTLPGRGQLMQRERLSRIASPEARPAVPGTERSPS